MGKQIARRRWRRGGAFALLGACVTLLAACGVTATGVSPLAGTGASAATTTTSATTATSVHGAPTNAANPQPGHPTLTCETTSSAQGVDVITTTLTCDVRNAPASDTTFMLTYSVASTTTGQTRLFTPVCSGPLRDGSGSCVQRYSAPVPLTLGKGIVSGKTSPGQLPLGPVTPQQGPAQTPPPGGPLPTIGPLPPVTPLG
jgi:hypothetical protein